MPSGRDSFRRNRVAPSLQIIPPGAGQVAFCVPPGSRIESTVDSSSIVCRFSLSASDRSGKRKGGMPPHSCMNVKTKELQNAFP